MRRFLKSHLLLIILLMGAASAEAADPQERVLKQLDILEKRIESKGATQTMI